MNMYIYFDKHNSARRINLVYNTVNICYHLLRPPMLQRPGQVVQKIAHLASR